ncbi:unnamed protein product, partial [Musa hybrid cultivar]
MVKAGKGRKEVVVTREYTINLHKRLHGCNLTLLFSVASPCVCWFFGSSPEGSLEVRGARRERSELAEEARDQKTFEQKAMGTTDVRVDVKLNKHIWSRGIRSVPWRVR